MGISFYSSRSAAISESVVTMLNDAELSGCSARCTEWSCVFDPSLTPCYFMRTKKKSSSQDEMSLKGLAAEAVYERRTWQG